MNQEKADQEIRSTTNSCPLFTIEALLSSLTLSLLSEMLTLLPLFSTCSSIDYCIIVNSCDFSTVTSDEYMNITVNLSSKSVHIISKSLPVPYPQHRRAIVCKQPFELQYSNNKK